MSLPPSLFPDRIGEMLPNIRGIKNRVAGAVSYVRSSVDAIRDRGEARRSERFRQKLSHLYDSSAVYPPPSDRRKSMDEVTPGVWGGSMSPKEVYARDVKRRLISATTKSESVHSMVTKGLRRGRVTARDLGGGSTNWIVSDLNDAVEWLRLIPEPKEPETKPWGRHKRDVSIGTPILDMAPLPDPNKDLAEVPGKSVTVGTQVERDLKEMNKKVGIMSTVASSIRHGFANAVARLTPKNNRRIYSLTRAQILERAWKEEKKREGRVKKADKERTKQWKKSEKERLKREKEEDKAAGKVLAGLSEWVVDEYGSMRRVTQNSIEKSSEPILQFE